MSQWGKNRSILMKDSKNEPRSSSEPAFTRVKSRPILLPPLARSALVKRRLVAKKYIHKPTIEPWHSSKVIDHAYIASLDSVSRLTISDEPRNKIQKKIGNPSFSLRGEDLKDPPKTLFRMTNLKTLVLSPDREACLECKLNSVPKEVGNLHNLRQLVLDTNDLKELPVELSELKQLDTLTLSNNHLGALPEGFSNLTNLRSLHLANNRFTEMPREVCFLGRLSFLDMSDNSIRKLPNEIDQLAPTLQMLFLYINDLARLPDSFCNLTELTTLWLGKNRLTKLPEQFGDLVNLDWADAPCETNIDDNPLVDPPLEICRKGVEEIFKYFASKEK